MFLFDSIFSCVFVSRGRRAVSYHLFFFSFSRTVKPLIINRETNRQSSMGSNVGLLPRGHAKPGYDADNVSLLLVEFKKRAFKCLFVAISNVRIRLVLIY